ncbi:hypothetical protein HFU84_08770, partial [Acidithiobacillus sp. CV18-2]|nr:hypothetical protein [Acidithiobacillus sp. CV18-3]MBU2758557.1 hypothetical protein [Acidithiobacillus sp. BN09-2]MBU2777594.1 hypothetical protein [Acidithiobacillus sp. CV18-2]MBU2799199.1 hypothetical protein [Acidithiobacillus sp. VAN18-4]
MTRADFMEALRLPVLTTEKIAAPASSWGIHSSAPITQTTLTGVTGILLDLDSKATVAPSFDDACEEASLLDFSAFAHTSYSHTPERPAYRVIVPLTGILEPVLTPHAVRIVMHLMPRIGSFNDRASIGIGRIFFLPATHPERVLLYRAFGAPEKPLLMASELAKWAMKLRDAEQLQAARRAPPPRARAQEGSPSIIQAFNEQATFEQLFEAAGYKMVRPGRWLSPNSKSGSAGITLNRESGRVFCGHESDPLFVPDRHSHDQFSVYCILWHGGDVTRAVAALKQGVAA